MARLIDADALIEELNKLAIKANDLGEYSATNFIINLVKNRPTAYDVEKVVAELESRKELLDIARIPTTQKNVGQNAYNMAIDIVKAGGVE